MTDSEQEDRAAREDLGAQGSKAGRVVVVTGGTAGIGRAAAGLLSAAGATVVVVGRDRRRGEAVLAELTRDGAGPVDLVLADLATRAGVRRVADEVTARHPRIDALVNNAGVGLEHRTVTADGLETTFAVNALAPFHLTRLLLPALQAGPSGRVVTVSSTLHARASIEFDDLMGERHWSGVRAYAQSKLAVVLFTYELTRRLAGTGVTANAVNPGLTATDGMRGSGPVARALATVLAPVAKSATTAARSLVHLTTSPEVRGMSGGYYDSRCRPARSAPASYDTRTAARLWAVSEELCAEPVSPPLPTR